MEPIARRRVRNRVLAVMAHTNRYCFRGQARLADDAGVSRSAVSRFLAGQSNPSFALVLTVTRALERQLGRRIDPRELVSPDGRFPTPSVCALCGCPGCLPDAAYDENDEIRPEFAGVRPGQWSLVAPLPAREGEAPSCFDTS